MALGSFIAGRAAGTYTVPSGSALDMGVMEGGYEVSARVAKELIAETDAYGQSVIDGVFRGISDVFIQATSIEWKAGIINACFPYGAAHPVSGAGYLGPGIIGRLDSDIAGSIILSAVSGTPGAAKPASLTATLCVIAEGFDVRWIIDSKLRKLPGRWRVLPYDSGAGLIKYYTVT